MVCADGQVIPCEQMPEVEEVFLGDLKKQSLQEIWESRELDERCVHFPRDRFKGTPCHTCDDFVECIHGMGYCMRDTSQFYGAVCTTPANCPKCEHPWVRTV